VQIAAWFMISFPDSKWTLCGVAFVYVAKLSCELRIMAQISQNYYLSRPKVSLHRKTMIENDMSCHGTLQSVLSAYNIDMVSKCFFSSTKPQQDKSNFASVGQLLALMLHTF